MPTVVQTLTQLVSSAVDSLTNDDTVVVEPVSRTQDAANGDYQSNQAFRLAKILRNSPRNIAEQIREALPAHPAVAGVDVAGPGFLNFRLDDTWIGEMVAEQAIDPLLSCEAVGESKTVVIDFSSPNVAKRMHVGHLRSTVIGAALYKLHAFVGYTVIGDNHIGDWGTQFGKLMVAWREWRDEDALEADPIGELQRIYTLFAQEAESNASLVDRAREETAKLQAGDPENLALWERFIALSMQEFNQVYDRMGIRFDVTLGESFYRDHLVELVDQLVERGLATEDEGAIVMRFTEEDGKNLSKTPMLVRKRDGAALYATTDLATIRHREATWNPARILYVTDARQQHHFKQLFAGARKAGMTEGELVHVWFGMLVLASGAMSTRQGNVINLVDLLNESARRARLVVDEKSPDLDDTERAAIAEAVGVGAVKYADLSQNPQSQVTFEWDRMLSMEGNTAPFLMYSYARCRSIQRKGEVLEPVVQAATLTLSEERDLALHLLRFPEAITAALDSYRPNLLCDYLFGLASTFNRFYYAAPVLKAEGATREARLSLVEATARVLAAGFSIVGLRPLERM